MFQKLSHNDTTTVPDVFSYGKTTGRYVIDAKFLKEVSTNETMLKRLCIVPKKTEYYNMIWDFDYKFDKCAELNAYVDQLDNITQHIIDAIIKQIETVFITTAKDIQYIYAIKNIGSGVHVYFSNIILNKEVHHYIFTKTLEALQEENYLTPTLLNHIFDSCVSKANGLRMFYFYNGDNFYYPCPIKSTYVFDKDPAKNILLSYTNTKFTDNNLKLKIDIGDIKNKIHKINNKKKDADKNNKIIKNDVEYIEDFDYMAAGDKKDMFLDLINILNPQRIEAYNPWVQLVFLFKTYKLKKQCIAFSKKSNKYDEKSKNMINYIFNKKENTDKCLTIGSLIYWCHEDNFMKTREILEKYDNNCCFIGLKSVDTILLHEWHDKAYTEDCKYISDFAQKMISDSLLNKQKDVIIIKSPTGSGKTTAICNILDKLTKADNDSQIISVITRRSLSACHKNAFNKKLNFISYLDNYKFEKKHFISSIEHLRHNDSDNYNILIIDELNSLLNYFKSDTLAGIRKECIERLLYLIKNADYIIACDMHITDACFKLFPNKNILFYMNTFQNKKGVKMNILYAQHSNENSYLTKIGDIIGKKYVKHNKAVLIFSDRKKTTIKLMKILKDYNEDNNYFVLLHAECGSQEDIEKLDELSKTKCIICSPRVIYGVDLSSYEYDDIYCIYSGVTGEDGLSAFHWYQQLSRSRHHKQINVYILNAYAKKYKQTFKTFNKCKAEEDKLIDHYMVFMKELRKNYGTLDDLVNNKSPIFREIHYYQKWYECAFNGNKCATLKLIAEEAGYIVTENEIGCDKIVTQLNNAVKEHNEIINEISHKIINNEEIDAIHKPYVKNLTEKIENKKRYVNKKYPDYNNIICNDELFKGHMNKKLLDMPKDVYMKELIKITNNDYAEVSKDDTLHKKISILFWLEEQLHIKRYEIDKLKDCNWQQIVNQLKNNKDKLIAFYNETGRSKKYANERLNNILNKIDSSNKIQKWLADVYNSIAIETIKYTQQKVKIKNKTCRIYIF